MKKYFLALALLLSLASCKSKEERTTNWINKDDGQWISISMKYEYTERTIVTLEKSGTVQNNGNFYFYDDGNGSMDVEMDWLNSSLITLYQWTVDGEKVSGNAASESPDAQSGVFIMSFEVTKVSKHVADLHMDYSYDSPGLEQTYVLDFRLNRR